MADTAIPALREPKRRKTGGIPARLATERPRLQTREAESAISGVVRRIIYPMLVIVALPVI